jgi:hypothetical protein
MSKEYSADLQRLFFRNDVTRSAELCAGAEHLQS